MTSKEALQSIRDYHNETVYDIDNIYTENMFEKELDIIEKDLKALEIIKEHHFLFVDKGELYVGQCCDVELLLKEYDFQDEHEYELLKKVFGNEK